MRKNPMEVSQIPRGRRATPRHSPGGRKRRGEAYTVSMYSCTGAIRPSRTVNTPMQRFSYGSPAVVRARLVHSSVTCSPSATMRVISRSTEPGW